MMKMISSLQLEMALEQRVSKDWGMEYQEDWIETDQGEWMKRL